MDPPAGASDSPPPPSEVSTADRSLDRHSSRREYQRTYVACVSCRTRKVKCIIGSEPPCAKCHREHRECVFKDRRVSLKQREPPTWSWEPVRPTTDMNQSPSSRTSSQDLSGRRSSRYLPATEPARSAQNGSLPSAVSRATAESQNTEAHEISMNTLNDQVVRTVVAKSSDALNLLFNASQPIEQASDHGTSYHASRHSGANGNTERPDENSSLLTRVDNTFTSMATPDSIGITPAISSLSCPTDEVLDVWDRCRFVRQGWFTSQEAVTYIDLFFQNMAHWSPILPEFYRYHYNHHKLITEEPVLCTTLLMVSSRYHTLPGVGGVSRGYHIHQRLWTHCEHLMQRIILGQEKYSTAKTRTLGAIESLLLISEWHPRAILFPPETDGWDAQLLSTDIVPRARLNAQNDSPPVRWREDVFLPTKRSDSMSWMLVSTATSLAYELGVFTTDDLLSSDSDRLTKMQHSRLRKVLYIYVNQVAARLGCPSMLPQNIAYIASEVLPSVSTTSLDSSWIKFVEHWIDITRLMKTAFDMLFPSAALTKQLLLSGRYIPLLQHFAPMLEKWHETFSSCSEFSQPYRDILYIEYHYVKAYINSLAIQAVVERALSYGADRIRGDQQGFLIRAVDPQDYKFIQEVVSSSRLVLKKGIDFVHSESLKYMPMRVLLRITSASLFLLKAISIGGPNAELQISLKILDESNNALRVNPLDDMDLASRYATLIERHVVRFRNNFTTSSQTDLGFGFAPDSTNLSNEGFPGQQSTGNARTGGTSGNDDSIFDGETSQYGFPPPMDNQMFSGLDEWSAQPFDPSLAPFATNGNQISLGLDADSLDFLWNAPTWGG